MKITIESADLRQAVLEVFDFWNDYVPEHMFRKPPPVSLSSIADSIVCGAENKGDVTE